MRDPIIKTLCGLDWLRSTTPTVAVRATQTVRIADLFSGCGGLSLGTVEAIQRHGLRAEIALAVDADRDALRVYERNLGSFCRTLDSSRIEQLFGGRLGTPPTLREKELAESIGTVEILVAGPPCQGHSDLNNHTRRLDHRNALYARVGRAAEVLQPAVVLIENVPGVCNDRGRVLSRVRKLLVERGYSLELLRLNAADLGVAQKRTRLFLLAIRQETARLWKPLPRFTGKGLTVGDVLSGLEDEPELQASAYRSASKCTARNQARIEFLFEHELYELPDSERPSCHRDKTHSYKAVYGRLAWDGIANTITSGFGSMGQGRYVHPTRRRTITPHEAARLQGFPDWFIFDEVESRGSLQTMIGNAVIPRTAAWLVHQLLETGVLGSALGAPTPDTAAAVVASRGVRLASV